MIAYAFKGIGKFAQILLPWSLHENTYAFIILLVTTLLLLLLLPELRQMHDYYLLLLLLFTNKPTPLP